MDPEMPPAVDGPPIRVLLIDAEPMSRLAWRHYFTTTAPAFTICGEAGTLLEARSRWRALAPEAVLLDPEMDGGGGWNLLLEMASIPESAACLVWLRQASSKTIIQALRSGARAVALRCDAPDEVLRALLCATVGLRHLTSRAASILADGLATETTERLPVTVAPTGRQAEVLRLLAEGLKTRAIAERLGVSMKTIQTHLYRLRTALGLHTHSDLVRFAAVQAAAVVTL